MSRVEIILGDDGSIKSEAFDFKGATCEAATQFLDELFGDADEVEHKTEYYLRNKNTDFICDSDWCG